MESFLFKFEFIDELHDFKFWFQVFDVIKLKEVSLWNIPIVKIFYWVSNLLFYHSIKLCLWWKRF